MGKEQNMREIIKARNKYQKKKVEAQREINKAMTEEEDRKLEEMRRKKSNRNKNALHLKATARLF